VLLYLAIALSVELTGQFTSQVHSASISTSSSSSFKVILLQAFSFLNLKSTQTFSLYNQDQDHTLLAVLTSHHHITDTDLLTISHQTLAKTSPSQLLGRSDISLRFSQSTNLLLPISLIFMLLILMIKIRLYCIVFYLFYNVFI